MLEGEFFSHATGSNVRKGEQVDFIQITPDGMREDMWHHTTIGFTNLLNAKNKALWFYRCWFKWGL